MKKALRAFGRKKNPEDAPDFRAPKRSVGCFGGRFFASRKVVSKVGAAGIIPMNTETRDFGSAGVHP